MLLKNFFGAKRAGHRDLEFDDRLVRLPLEEERRLYAAHGAVPIDRHLEILFADDRIGAQRYVDMYRAAMRDTGTVVTPFNVFQRFETRRQLYRYLFATLAVPGARAECGVYRGATALLLCRALRSQWPDFDGTGMHMIDSFSGTSRSVAQDFIPVREADGTLGLAEFFPEGKTDTSADLVRSFFSPEFPGAAVHAGWIPDVFSSLPECAWAYVHLDLSLYEPTLAALEYFYPRLSEAGAILCDSSIFCPGVEAAVVQFCERMSLPYLVLGHREYVLTKNAA